MYEFNSLIDGDTAKYDAYLMEPVMRDLRRAQTRNADAAAYGHYARAAGAGQETEEGEWRQEVDGSFTKYATKGPRNGLPIQAMTSDLKPMPVKFRGNQAAFADEQRALIDQWRDVDPNARFAEDGSGYVLTNYQSETGKPRWIRAEALTTMRQMEAEEARQPTRTTAIDDGSSSGGFLRNALSNLGTVNSEGWRTD